LRTDKGYFTCMIPTSRITSAELLQQRNGFWDFALELGLILAG
jgi:hypothetical protein